MARSRCRVQPIAGSTRSAPRPRVLLIRIPFPLLIETGTRLHVLSFFAFLSKNSHKFSATLILTRTSRSTFVWINFAILLHPLSLDSKKNGSFSGSRPRCDCECETIHSWLRDEVLLGQQTTPVRDWLRFFFLLSSFPGSHSRCRPVDVTFVVGGVTGLRQSQSRIVPRIPRDELLG